MFLSHIFERKTDEQRAAEERNKLNAQILAEEFNLFIAKSGYGDRLKCEKSKLTPDGDNLQCDVRVDRKGLYGIEEYYEVAARFARKMERPATSESLPRADWNVNDSSGYLAITFKTHSVKDLEERIRKAEDAVDIRYASAGKLPASIPGAAPLS